MTSMLFYSRLHTYVAIVCVSEGGEVCANFILGVIITVVKFRNKGNGTNMEACLA